MSVNEKQQYRFRLSCGEWHVDLEMSKEQLAQWVPDRHRDGLGHAAWLLMDRLDANVPNREDGRRPRPWDGLLPCPKCSTGWLLYQIKFDAEICTDCGHKEPG